MADLAPRYEHNVTFAISSAVSMLRTLAAPTATRAAWLYFTWIALASSAPAMAKDAPTRYWFEPSLSVNADSICPQLLADTRRVFKSEAPWDDYRQNTVDRFSVLKQIPAPDNEDEVPDLTVSVIPGTSGGLAVTLPGGAWVYTFDRTHPGCGGACESYASIISDKPDAGLTRDLDDGETSDYAISSTPATGGGWTPHKSAAGDLFTAGIVDERLHVYKAHAPGQWILACEIVLIPPDIRERKSRHFRAALHAIDALAATSGVMAGEEGDCGSMHTSSRWAEARASALLQALYRPWALTSDETISDNSSGNYRKIEPDLLRWSLGGLHEYRALSRYRKQLRASAHDLARFYVKVFRWTPGHAEAMADRSLKNAIAQGFGFYRYAPYSGPAEEQLRRAILERLPIEQIRAIEFDAAAIDRTDVDSILNVAVTYPEALDYLLNRGVRAGGSNGFGKTPLMYAAQYDQIESVRLLLAAGADANAATTDPRDTCTYTLEARSVTALHYAARYASVPLIELLMDSGANPLAESWEGSIHRPIDWIGRNTKLHPSERRAIEDALRANPLSEQSGTGAD